MTPIEALILGIVQGITEFLPISSSGHLKLGQLLLGLKDLHQYVLFDLVCHFGTLLAVLIVLRKEIIQLFTTDRSGLGLIVLATLPLIPLYPLLSLIKAFYGLPQYLGFFFLITALLLFAAERFARLAPAEITTKRNCLDVVFIGCAQAVALLPGVSRSGSTMAAARFLGWNRQKAAQFSFLLAIPTISAGILLETIHLLKTADPAPTVSILTYFTGFIVSFVVGALVLSWFLKLLKTITFKPFAWYCLIIGLITLIYVNFLL